jgi:uncharacterized protein YjiS (DUF1127 family)
MHAAAFSEPRANSAENAIRRRFFAVQTWFASRRQIRRTERELSALSDRELRDLGLFRHDIKRIARLAVADNSAG